MVLALTSCTSVPKDDGNYGQAFLANSQEEYAELGLSEITTEIWEDEMRTDCKEGSYGWWYMMQNSLMG